MASLAVKSSNKVCISVNAGVGAGYLALPVIAPIIVLQLMTSSSSFIFPKPIRAFIFVAIFFVL
ncbi:hypothetical protein D3C81_1799510 [compost metagenome]